MAKAKRRRLAAIEKQNKNSACFDVFPQTPKGVESIHISDLLEVEPQNIEYRKQKVIVLIPPLPKDYCKHSHVSAHGKPKKLVPKVLDIRNQQLPTHVSGNPSPGPLKLILKHGTWCREKLIGKFHFPSNIPLKVAEQPADGRLCSPGNLAEPTLKATRVNHRQREDLGHDIPDDTTLLEVQKVLGRPAPNFLIKNHESRIGGKMGDPLWGDPCKMVKQDPIKEHHLQAHVRLSYALDNMDHECEEKSASLQANLPPNLTHPSNKEESFCLDHYNSGQRDNETISYTAIRPPDIADTVTLARRIRQDASVTQSNLQTHDTCVIRLPQFYKASFVSSQLVPLCTQKSAFGSFRGPIVGKREKIDLVQEKLEKAGGLQSWLVKSGLGQFVKLFQEKNIEISQLLELNMGALKQMGAAAVGPRRKLIHAIDCLF